MKFTRRTGFIARKSGGYLVLYRYLDNTKIILHPSFVFIYALVNGERTKSEIIELASANIKNQKTDLDKEIQDVFEELVSLGVIKSTFKQKDSPNFISIAFQNFWPQFDISKNYFVESLLQHFIPVIVESELESPNLIFIGDTDPDFLYDHSKEDCISIGIQSTASQEASSTFDFEIRTESKKRRKNGYHIPLWALYFPWQEFVVGDTPTHHLTSLKGFHPEALGQELYSFLDTYYKDVTVLNGHSNGNMIEHPKGDGKLTIGMATFDDYDGPYFTLQAIRLYHQEVLDRLEFIILDNNPGGKVGDALKSLEDWIPNYRYIPFDEYNGTTTRDVFFREANTEYVMSVDSHVMLQAGSIKQLLDYLDDHPQSLDLFQGPMLHDDVQFQNYSSSFRAEWKDGMYGRWVQDPEGKEEGAEPFPIPMQGLGLFVCRKSAWLGFNSRFRGFGGEEGYIHEKFRLAGRQTICLPFLKWLHRFGRPNGTNYPNIWEDRIRNYYLGFDEIGWDTSTIDFHFSEHLGQESYQKIQNLIQYQVNHPLYHFDAVYLLVAPKDKLQDLPIHQSIADAHIDQILRRYEYSLDNEGKPEYNIATEEIIDKSVKYGFKSVMVIHDKAILNKEFRSYFSDLIKNLKLRTWGSLHVGLDIRENYLSIIDKNLFVSESIKPSNTSISAFNLEYLIDIQNLPFIQKPTSVKPEMVIANQ